MVPKKSGVREKVERFDIPGDKIRGYLERNIYFDISHAPVWGKTQLECTVKVLAADHILFGSSCLLRGAWLLKGVEFLRNLDIGEKEKSQILGGNSLKLFNIK